MSGLCPLVQRWNKPWKLSSLEGKSREGRPSRSLQPEPLGETDESQLSRGPTRKLARQRTGQLLAAMVCREHA